MTEPTMTWDVARKLTDEVKGDARKMWRKLVRLYEGHAHEALGFKSWGAYCAVEFNLNSSQAYRLLDAGRVAQLLADSPGGEPQTEAVARELAPLRDQPDEAREAWHEAIERHGPTPTAQQVREVVRPPAPPGDDLRWTRVEDAADSFNRLPPLDRLAFPVEAGDVVAMDAAVRLIVEYGPRLNRAWKAHVALLPPEVKAALREARPKRGKLRAVA